MADRSFAAGRFMCIVGDETAGFIKDFDGGDIEAEKITHNLGTSNYQKKNISNIKHNPVTLNISLAQGRAMWEWVEASFNQGFVEKTVELHAANFNHEVQSIRVFSDCHIEKVKFPDLDASSKESAYAAVTCNPRQIRYEMGDKSKISGEENTNAKKWTVSNWRFEMGDLKCDRVTKISGIEWTQKVVEDKVGAFREPMKEAAALEVNDITVTFSAADIQTWQDWHKSFVIDGMCAAQNELSGSITFLDNSLNEELMSISLVNCGIMSLKTLKNEANKDSILHAEAKLYVEEIKIDTYVV